MQINANTHADIIAWIDSAFEGPAALQPQDPNLRAEMEALLRGPCSRVVSAGLSLVAGAFRLISECLLNHGMSDPLFQSKASLALS